MYTTAAITTVVLTMSAAAAATTMPAAMPATPLRAMKVPWSITEFDGKNVTSYLRKYNLLAEDCGIVNTKVHRFTAYCTTEVIPHVESLAGYDTQDWDSIEASLKRYYIDQDPEQLEYQVPFLRSLADKQRQIAAAATNAGTTDLMSYSVKFLKIAETLIQDQKITQYSACAEYLRGVPDKIQDNVQRNLGIEWDNARDLDVGAIIRNVIEMEDRRLERIHVLGSTAGPASNTSPPLATPAESTVIITGSIPKPVVVFTTSPQPNELAVLSSRLNDLNAAVDAMTNACQWQNGAEYEDYY